MTNDRRQTVLATSWNRHNHIGDSVTYYRDGKAIHGKLRSTAWVQDGRPVVLVYGESEPILIGVCEVRYVENH